MSHEFVYCEKCGARGNRPLTHFAPSGWLYMETVIETPTGPTATDKVITYACKPECAQALWREGPGPQVPGVGDLVNQAIKKLEAGLPLDVPSALSEHDVARIAAKVEAAKKRPPCIFAEGSCGAADCPEHGWVPSDG